MNSNTVIVAKIFEQTVGAAVEVVAGDDRRVWFHNAGDDVEGRHA